MTRPSYAVQVRFRGTRSWWTLASRFSRKADATVHARRCARTSVKRHAFRVRKLTRRAK